jgi:hypothetical protein
MTTKEKAIQILDRFIQLNGNSFFAKECSLFLVDEILKQFDGLHKPEYCSFDAIGERKFTFESEYPNYMTGYDMIEYWKQVKIEIEKIL